MDGSVDQLTRAGVTLDILENKINAKQLLYTYIRAGSGLGVNASIEFYVKTDPDYEAHILPIFAMQELGQFEIYKFSVAPTSPSTPNPVYTRKYQKTATAAAKTKIWQIVTGGTSAVVFDKEFPVDINLEEPKFVLEKDTWYRFVFWNRGAATARAMAELIFWEANVNVAEGEDRDNPDLLTL